MNPTDQTPTKPLTPHEAKLARRAARAAKDPKASRMQPTQPNPKHDPSGRLRGYNELGAQLDDGTFRGSVRDQRGSMVQLFKQLYGV